MTSHVNDRKPGSVTTDMTNRNRDLAKRETGVVTAGSGQAARRTCPVSPARFGTVVHRMVPAHLACRIGARARAGERDPWPAVVAIALGTFALVFSELIPVGLLADISGHLRVSVGTGGLMVVVPAVTAAVAAPLLTLCSARLERRAVLVGLSALVLVSDVIGGLAPGIGVMLAARAVLGICVGGFWRPGPVRLRAARFPSRRLGGRRDRLRRRRSRRHARAGRRGRRPGRADPAGPGRRGHQLPAGGAGRSGRRTGPGRADPAARRNRSSSKQCMTTILTSPFAAIPRPRPERKELP